MSVYCFGKIIAEGSPNVLRQKIRALAQSSSIEMRFGTHEPDDEKVLNEPRALRGDGTVFSLFTPNDSDIIAVYNEATNEGRRAILETMGEGSLPYSWDQARVLSLPDQVFDAVLHSRLGRFVKGLFELEEARCAGLALFDNGIERIIEETPDNCLLLILKSLLVSWDLGPSALFVWQSSRLT